MDSIIDNWFVVVAGIVVGVVIIECLLNFFQMPSKKQIQKVKEWLLYAVILAEKELGSGTGKLKLRYVYDMFASKFPWIAKIMTFEYFSTLVDEALEEMKNLLNQNKNIKEFVEDETWVIQ